VKSGWVDLIDGLEALPAAGRQRNHHLALAIRDGLLDGGIGVSRIPDEGQV
jgi:hypothetical protein